MANYFYDRLVALFNDYGMLRVDNKPTFIGNYENGYNILNAFADIKKEINNRNKDILYTKLQDFVVNITNETYIKEIKFNDRFRSSNLGLIVFYDGYYRYSGRLSQINGEHENNYANSVQLLDFYTKICEGTLTSYISIMQKYMKRGEKSIYYKDSVLFNSDTDINNITFRKGSENTADVIKNHAYLNMLILKASKENYSFRSPDIFFHMMRLFYYTIVQLYNQILTNNLILKIENSFKNNIIDYFNNNVDYYNRILNNNILQKLEDKSNYIKQEFLASDYENYFEENKPNNYLFNALSKLEYYKTLTDLSQSESPSRDVRFINNNNSSSTILEIKYSTTGGTNTFLTINLNASSNNNPLKTKSLAEIERYNFINYGGTLTQAAFEQYKKDITTFKMYMFINGLLDKINTTDYANDAFKESIKKMGEISKQLKKSYEFNQQAYKNMAYKIKDNDFIDEYTSKRSELGTIQTKISVARDSLNTNVNMVSIYKNDEQIQMILLIISIIVIVIIIIALISIITRSDRFKISTATSLLVLSISTLVIFILVRKLYVVNMEDFENITDTNMTLLLEVFDSGRHYLDFSSNNNFYKSTLLPAIDKEYDKVSTMKMITYKDYNNSTQYINDTLFNTAFYRELATYLIVLCIIVLIYYILSIYIPDNNTWLFVFLVVAIFSMTWYTIWVITTRYRPSYKHNTWRDPNYTP